MADDVAPGPEDRGRGWNLRGRKCEGSGRAKGTPNKVTREFRAIVQDLIDENADNVRVWLKQTAEGVPAEIQRNEDGSTVVIRAAVAGDPGKAVDLLNKLAEYAAPKLSRRELTGPNGTPLAPPSVHVTIEGKPPGDEPTT